MNTKDEFFAYLEQESIRLNSEFPQHKETTSELFQQLRAFCDSGIEELTDNRVYRCFLNTFKEMICCAFEANVPKAYLRCFFKSLHNQEVIRYLGSYAKSREKNIHSVMDRFLNYFVMTWQGYNDDRQKVLEDIIRHIDNWM